MWHRLRVWKWARALRAVCLTRDERAEMRRVLGVTIAAAPANHHTIAPRGSLPPSGWARFLTMLRQPLPAAAFVAGVVIVVGSGTAIAAERSLPGEFLYPVKVNVSEEFRSVIAVSPRARAVWHARRAERRLSEAETLAARGKLSERIRASLDERFSAHVRATEQSTAVIEARGEVATATAIRSDFEAILRAHDETLDRIVRGGDADRLLPVRARVRAAITAITPVRAATEARIAGTGRVPVAEVQRQIRAGKRAKRVAERRLERGDERLDREVAARARAQITVAAESLDASRAQLEAGASSDAFLRAGEALRAARQAETLLRADRALPLRGDGRRAPRSHRDGTTGRERASDDTRDAPVDASDDPRSVPSSVPPPQVPRREGARREAIIAEPSDLPSELRDPRTDRTLPSERERERDMSRQKGRRRARDARDLLPPVRLEGRVGIEVTPSPAE